MRGWFWIIGAALLGAPWIVIRFGNLDGNSTVVALFSGLAILGGAFLLSWGAEVAQIDISQSLALAFLALIAVLPEYAVDMYFAWTAGKNPVYAAYATANMTGSNRLLIGAGWAVVVLLFWLRYKKSQVVLEAKNGLELTFLALATLYSFIIPFKAGIAWYDSIILLGLFAWYVRLAVQQETIEPELEGPSEQLALLPRFWRRLMVVLMFGYAGFLIFIAAQPFAESLISIGKALKIEEFLLVQWLAPLASEAPEFIVAAIFAWRGAPAMGLGALLSSKINQWTLLIGMLPLAYNLSGGHLHPLPLDARQVEELLLTSAQSFFGFAVLCNLSLSVKEAFLLLILFLTQLCIPITIVRYIFVAIYLILGCLIIFKDRKKLKSIAGLTIRLFKAKPKA
jgi:cation:H+ antiporter